MAESKRPRVLSGIQPTGGLHLGNYLGALRNWVRDQDQYENYFCIVDLHALTVPWDAKVLHEHVLQLAAFYLACGLDPSRCELFVQSQVPAHAELGWIMQCLTPMGWLERMTQFKSKTQGQNKERVGTGLFTYPTLMAADILLYDADFVPVGEDQRQHVELCRDLAQRLNSQFGDVVKVPKSLVRETGARVMGLDDPTGKMSKSVGMERPGHAIFLLDEPNVIKKKIARAQTDTQPAVKEPLGPGVENLIDIYASITDQEVKKAYAEFEGSNYGTLKSKVGDAVVSALEPIQKRYREIRSDDAELQRALDASSQRAGEIAQATLMRVQKAIGLRA